MLVFSKDGVAVNIYYCDPHWLQMHRSLRVFGLLDRVLKVVAV